MADIRLICTDLDGTLFSEEVEAEDLAAFRSALAKLRRGTGACWTIVTGRPAKDREAILMQFMTAGLVPNYLIFEDALIYRRTGRGRFTPFHWWNFKVWWRRTQVTTANKNAVALWRRHLLNQFPHARDRGRQQIDLWLEFGNEDEARRAEHILQRLVHDRRHFYIFRWGPEVCLAPAAGTKGEAVNKLAKTLNVPHRHIFAVGDGPNDVTMLEQSVAGMPACVDNALPYIKRVVRKAGGYVCKASAAKGVVEALDYYMNRQE